MTELELESYAVGTNIAASLIQTTITLDTAALIDAITDVLGGKETKISPEDIDKHLQSFSKKIQDKQMSAMNAAAEENLAKGKEFLKANKAKEGVTVTPSGLQYEVLVQGDGEKPTAESTVVVHYAGTSIEGTEFDSSYSRGEPAQFPVGGVIPGWTEALLLMNVGSKYKLTIPSGIAYGQQGAGQAIGPNETLCFEVELLEIV